MKVRDAVDRGRNDEVWVPVQEDGRVPVLRAGDRDLLMVVTSLEDLPAEPPPGCREWQRVSRDQLASIVPVNVLLYPYPQRGTVAPCEPALAGAAERLRRDEMDETALLGEFRRAVVYCQAGERPGFVGGEAAIAVFSSLATLARALGDTPWFSTTGEDLLGLLPRGFGLVLDPGTPHEWEVPVRDTEL